MAQRTALIALTVGCAFAAWQPAAAHAGLPTQSGTLIALPDGDVQGVIDGETRAFFGIPFAAPPVGPLRWRPPAPVTPWVGTLDASAYSVGCPQADGLIGVASEEEDCLYLNVWTTEQAPSEPLPVMVWIHGGGNTTGSTGDLAPFPPYESDTLYGADLLASERGVVVVSMNYRLGVFGFFGHSDLALEDGGNPYTGNQGLLDQRQALEWVRDNIGAFGGDPNNVTIFGESAGSWDVCYHVASPLSAGLFHRAISQSGGCTVGTRTSEESATYADTFTAAVGCDGAPDVLACLRALPVATLLANASENQAAEGVGADTGANVDGNFLLDDPRVLFTSGEVNKVPYILGANSDEGSVFFIGATPLADESEYQAALFSSFGDFATEIETLYPASDFDSPQAAFVRVIGDSSLVCTTYDTAARFAALKRTRAYAYNFDRVIPLPFVNLLDLGVLHGAELAYVFGSVDPPSPTDALLGEKVRNYWSTFAEKGKPRAKRSVGWPRFKAKSWRMVRLTGRNSKLKDFRRPECEFWSSYYDAQAELR